jgi:NADH-quinone oxidoreductase subunit L
LLLAIPLLPLVASIVAGLFGKVIGRAGAHFITIAGVAISCALSIFVFKQVAFDDVPTFNGTVYNWLTTDTVNLQVGFLVDRLSAMMMVVVTFVSLCVHVYTIGYMADDAGYQRFFSYISLFTFSMLMLVMSNNFMQLFFGWEAVGVVSYLLIGFWYTRPTAIFANLKAFLVNRVGDFGFVLGIAGVVYFTNSLDYKDAFAAAPQIAQQTFQLTATHSVHAMTLICICLFVGAMGKSAQMPLHVWLPDSMEGPTPISALIHAATMVTAGIFMVARMSPLFEHSEEALSFVLVIGASTAFFMGLLGIVNNDIKRVVAYSTLSQLGYMTVALGVSAYSAGMFHLMTHAFFKALLFLAAGSVIIGMHHEQDMRKMGGLAKYMPWTAVTSWIGSLALIGTPFFSGFYSKDAIIEAVGESHRWGATYAYYCVLAGVFVTALYSFRMIFMTFHGPERWKEAMAHGHGAHDSHGAHSNVLAALGTHGATADSHDTGKAPITMSHARETEVHAEPDAHDSHHGHGGPPHETGWVIRGPLIALAIPSVIIGALTIGTFLFGDFFKGAIFVHEHNDVIGEMAREQHAPMWLNFALHGFTSPPFFLALAGVLTAWVFFLWKPTLADSFAKALKPVRELLINKYFFDWINENIIAAGSRLLGRGLWRIGDQGLIDGAVVNGSAATVGWFGSVLRHVQSGYLYSYAFWMVIGLAVLLGWFLFRF